MCNKAAAGNPDCGLFGYDDPLGTERSFGGAVKRKGC